MGGWWVWDVCGPIYLCVCTHTHTHTPLHAVSTQYASDLQSERAAAHPPPFSRLAPFLQQQQHHHQGQTQLQQVCVKQACVHAFTHVRMYVCACYFCLMYVLCKAGVCACMYACMCVRVLIASCM